MATVAKTDATQRGSRATRRPRRSPNGRGLDPLSVRFEKRVATEVLDDPRMSPARSPSWRSGAAPQRPPSSGFAGPSACPATRSSVCSCSRHPVGAAPTTGARRQVHLLGDDLAAIVDKIAFRGCAGRRGRGPARPRLRRRPWRRRRRAQRIERERRGPVPSWRWTSKKLRTDWTDRLRLVHVALTSAALMQPGDVVIAGISRTLG